MDWFPLLNSLRVASLATVITFFLGVFVAAGVMRCPTWLKGALD
ncbi:MAG: molybdate ABC transporter permease subunit, partial [Clostridia bacterium]|nr:molybdate ABC transporter permease subunit [Clostridia bacterium]